MQVFSEFSKKDMQISCGKSTVTLSGQHLLAFKEWSYDGKVICNVNGFNGTVIATAPGKFIGVGHYEGGREEPLDFDLSIDGKNIRNFADKFNGNTAEYLRVTNLNTLQLGIKNQLAENEIFSSCMCLASEDIPIDLFYCHQYSWSTAFDNFIYADLDGNWHSGSCKSNNEMIYWQRISCAALYAPEYRLAIAFAPDPETAKISTGKLWDREIYHKFYCELDLKGVITAWSKSAVHGFYMKILRTDSNLFFHDINKFSASLPEIWKKHGFYC